MYQLHPITSAWLEVSEAREKAVDAGLRLDEARHQLASAVAACERYERLRTPSGVRMLAAADQRYGWAESRLAEAEAAHAKADARYCDAQAALADAQRLGDGDAR